MRNSRLNEAIEALVAGEGDVRDRVAIACRILHKINKMEESLQEGIYIRLKKVLDDAKKYGPVRDQAGNIIRDAYENTKIRRKNKSYVRLAKEIYSIYKENEGAQ